MRKIRKCPACGTYTLSETCSCSIKTILPKPAKYSPEDKFARFRRQAKEEQRKQEGLL